MNAAAPRPLPTSPPLPGRAVFAPLCLTLGLVLAVHAPHLPAWLTAALAALLAVRAWPWRHWKGTAPAWLKLPLLALLVGAVIAAYGTLFGRDPGSALAVGLLVLKLFECGTPRDVRVSVGFACFALMAALLFDQGLIATVLVACGLLPALATLRALEPAVDSPPLLRALLPGAALLGVSLPVAVFAFVLIPRLDAPLWGAPRDARATTGLADSMAPGDFVELLTDDHPALRVSFDGPPPAAGRRYFRAYVLWRYDGERWRRAEGAGEAAVVATIGAPVAYRIDLEPSDQRVLPALDMPLDVPAATRRSGAFELLREQPVRDRLSYRLSSALDYRLQPALDAGTRRLALGLPPGLDPRSHALAEDWRARHGGDGAAIVQEALNLFREGGFRYSLAPPPLGHHRVDDFLFSTREGYCEHYAAAFTVLMRAAGVPARIVTGYQGGFWNTLGDYLLIRRSDAHAWSEVWLAGRGWVRVDPTAVVRARRLDGRTAGTSDAALGWNRSWLSDWRDRWDVVNRWWAMGVVGFDALRQRGLLTPFGIDQADSRTLGTALAVGAVLAALLGLAWALWRREPRDPVSAAWQQLQRKLARLGVVRRRGEGPRHFLHRAARKLPRRRKELERLLGCYLELRYARTEASTELLENFRRAVRDFSTRRMVQWRSMR
ncbi:tansglutaminase-like enzymes, putative cysteine proteases [Aerosticca soli]|uniref:Tansglutaminase-like enzymes, putative cysteine proteases n=1 Tax=Aerosticca soli TaxID=2010829 RepID=A0A2Z6E3X8_9GAMM|nr:tansglutaminase-like enzymes, putative cysteine proteases [Aerosticca soli]